MHNCSDNTNVRHAPCEMGEGEKRLITLVGGPLDGEKLFARNTDTTFVVSKSIIPEEKKKQFNPHAWPPVYEYREDPVGSGNFAFVSE